MDILARGGGESVRCGMVAIGNFTKIATVIPIESRQPIELISALKLIVQSMGTPKQLYSNEKSSFRAKVFFRFVNDIGIKHIQTSTHAPSAERFIKTFKDNLYRRLDGLKQDRGAWVKHVKILLVSIIMQNITTKTKPLDAVKKESHLWVTWHLQPVLTNTGDTLRLMRVIWVLKYES